MLHASVEITYADVSLYLPARCSIHLFYLTFRFSCWIIHVSSQITLVLSSIYFFPLVSHQTPPRPNWFLSVVGQVQLVFLEMMSEPVLTSTKGEIMNRCPIRNGFNDVCHPPGIDLQCYPEDECELLSAAVMREMSFLSLVSCTHSIRQKITIIALTFYCWMCLKNPLQVLPAFTAFIQEFWKDA